MSRQASPAGPLYAIALDSSQIGRASRSIRVPVTREDAERFRDAIVERVKPFIKTAPMDRTMPRHQHAPGQETPPRPSTCRDLRLRHLLILVALVLLGGCSGQPTFTLERIPGSALTSEVLSVQIYEQDKATKTLLTLLLYQIGNFDLRVGKTGIEADDDKVGRPPFQTTFSEL